MIAPSDFESIILHPSFAGLVGSLLSLYDFDPKVPKENKWNKAPGIFAKFIRVIGGMACVWYIAPVFASITHVTTIVGRPALGFFMGFVGIDLLLKFLAWFKKTDFISIITVLRSGGKNDFERTR